MTAAMQAQTFGDIRIEGQGNLLVVNQVVQISAREVLSRAFLPASPYRGLEAFDDKHSHLFCGRDALIAKLLKAVPQHPLLMISGASGSGKSSVVRAGLLPQLAQRVQGFRAFKMKPGSDPFVALKYGLVGGALKESKIGFAATAHSDTLLKLAALRPKGECWLLLVDQFEEMFTLCDGTEKRSAFFKGLISLAASCPPELRVVLTMRSDFFDRFDLYPELLEQVRRGLLFVTSPTADELRQCIEQPAAQHGVVFEDGLVSQILAELQGRPGTLPLLQYMLDLLWHEDNPASDKTLSKSSYLAIQGVKGALCQRADMVYACRDDAPRSEAEQQMMRRIFLQLVGVSGQEDAAPTVSRRRPLGQFSEAEQAIVRELIEEKLLISNLEEAAAKGGVFEQATVELAHESLISAWPTLTVWLKEARQVLFIRDRLSNDTAEWQRLRQQNPHDSSRADEELWSGTRLSNALEMRARGDFRTVLGKLSNEEEAFLNASEAFVAERLRREREAAEKIRQLLLDSYVERGHRFLFEKSEPYSAALWLHRAYKGGSKDPVLTHLLKSAMLPIEATRSVLSGHGGDVWSASFSPDGGRIVTASEDGTARVWNAGNGRLVAELKGHSSAVLRASFSPEGGRIVTASGDGTARVWNAGDGRLEAELKGHGNYVQSASFSPEGGRIITASRDWTARVWDAGDGRLVADVNGNYGSPYIGREKPSCRRPTHDRRQPFRIPECSADHAYSRRLRARQHVHAVRGWTIA